MAKIRSYMNNDKSKFDREIRDQESKYEKLVKAAEPQCTKA